MDAIEKIIFLESALVCIWKKKKNDLQFKTLKFKGGCIVVMPIFHCHIGDRYSSIHKLLRKSNYSHLILNNTSIYVTTTIHVYFGSICVKLTHYTIFWWFFLCKKRNKNEKGGFATTLLPRQLALLLCDSFKDLCSYLLLLLYSHCSVMSKKVQF